MPNILAVLDISTKHLDPATAARLDDLTHHEWPVSGGHIPFGYFVYAHDEDCIDVRGNIPADLWNCIEYARRHGCSHLRFDCDAAAYDDLETYDWS